MQCHGCGSFLEPGLSECPRCGTRIHNEAVRRPKDSAPAPTPIVRNALWIGVGALLLTFLIVFVAYRPMDGRFGADEAAPEPPTASVDLAIWPIIQHRYPDLTLQWKDFAGTRYVAVPDVFWRTLLPSEKKRLAVELDALFPARDWVVITGRYRGIGEMALEHRRERWELLGVPSGEGGVGEADSSSPQPAMVKPRALFAEAASRNAGASMAGADPASPSKRAGAPNRSAAGLSQGRKHRLPGVPEYQVLLSIDGLSRDRTYGEVLIPELSPRMPLKERERIARIIAEHESLDSLTLYSTREARLAHYSMDYADGHPDALKKGLVGILERGRFKPYEHED